MKRLLIFHALFFLLIQFSIGQILWEKTWGGPYDDVCEVHATHDGGSILVASYGPDSWILKLDGNGDTSWTKRIALPLDFCSIVETDQGDFLATGTTRYVHRDIFVWKLNSHGDSLWTQTYIDTTSSQGLYAIRSLQGGNFLVTGYNNFASNFDMLAMKIDSLGNQIWRKTYGTPGFEAGAMPAFTSDGGFVFATTAGPSATPYFWLVRTDSLGDTLWTKTYPRNLPTGGAIPLVRSNGQIFVLGWIEDNGNYDNHLLCLDSLGNELWIRNYGGIGFESRTAAGIIADRLGGYTFASSVDFGFGPGTDRDMAIYRIDDLGNVLQIHRLGHGKDDMPRYFDQMSNGDYLVAGWSESFIPSGQQSYLARLSNGGCGEFFYQMPGAIFDSICPGDSVLLDAGNGFQNYIWNDGIAGQTRYVNIGDTFSVVATDSNGCLNYSNSVLITAQFGPNFSWLANGTLGINFDGNSGNSNANIQWDFGDSNTASGEDQMHIYLNPGTYWVCISQEIAGCGILSFCDSVTVGNATSIKEENIAKIELYPNPTNGKFSILHSEYTSIKARIWNSKGQFLHEFELNEETTSTLNLNFLPNGIYFVQILTEDQQVFLKKLILQH